MNAFPSDTIAAIATAPGEGAVAVLRVSGPAAMAVADAIFRCAGEPPSRRPSHTVVHGRVEAGDGTMLDDILLLLMRAPRSYTGEDVVEFQCHGGRLSSARVLRRLLESGCRAADPGEFTRRAFLNGRMDLSQAEAVLDLIRARSERAATAAIEQLAGRLGHRIDGLYARMVALLARLEFSLDFGDDEQDFFDAPAWLADLRAVADDLVKLRAEARGGRQVRDGARVVILGRPNAGKSSLFNALLGFSRAIVSEHPGTTRDTLEESVELDGFLIRLVDTAGLRRTACAVEAEGVARAEREIAASDIRLLVVDSSQCVTQEDIANIGEADDSALVLALNKSDLPADRSWDEISASVPKVRISCATGHGLDALVRELVSLVSSSMPGTHEHTGLVSIRHEQLLASAEVYVVSTLSKTSCMDCFDFVAAAVSMRSALDAIGAITGRRFDDALLNSIFSQFCVGK